MEVIFIVCQVREAVFRYARDNIAVVKVFARDPYYTLIQRDKKMTTISFVGNTGCHQIRSICIRDIL